MYVHVHVYEFEFEFGPGMGVGMSSSVGVCLRIGHDSADDVDERVIMADTQTDACGEHTSIASPRMHTQSALLTTVNITGN